ncbi:MAG TPA: hydroxysqualene dehydroxylase HpnE [Stellaceae bacterium]|nr:hydroxysqualene dehydroxylase HpnE [Stellaceae bacterium]
MSPLARVHVVGAGLAGLAAAVRLADAGIDVVLHESAQHAGGRCRSYFDAALGCRIDNGNHLLMSGNRAAMDYLAAIGAMGTLDGPAAAEYPFLDLATGERWVLRPGAGRVPWWLLDRARRVPGTRLRDYLGAVALARAGRDRTVAQVLDPRTALYRRFWRPLAVAALNTAPGEGSAALLARVVAESFGRGGAACRPLLPREGLSETLIDPALAHLARRGASLRLTRRLRALEMSSARVERLGFETDSVALGPDEAVILAVPAPVAVRLVPGLDAPADFRAIVNAHYRIAVAAPAPLFVGIIGGTAEWVFLKREVLSVTVSAADRLVDEPADDLAVRLWRDVERAYDLPHQHMPPAQIVKERRATFAATPAALLLRPPARTLWANLALAGDWTDTGLPATIEGAIRSGFAASDLLLSERAR